MEDFLDFSQSFLEVIIVGFLVDLQDPKSKAAEEGPDMSAVDVYLIDVSDYTVDVFEGHLGGDYHGDFRDEVAVFEVFRVFLRAYSIFYEVSSLSFKAF